MFIFWSKHNFTKNESKALKKSQRQDTHLSGIDGAVKALEGIKLLLFVKQILFDGPNYPIKINLMKLILWQTLPVL